MKLEKMILLSEAAERLGLPESKLRARIKNGDVEAATLPDGRIVVAEKTVIRKIIDLQVNDGFYDVNSQLRSVSKSNFVFLNGNQLTITEAAEKYQVSQWTVRYWIRQGYIEILIHKYPLRINEMDMAYCAAIFKKQKAAGCEKGAPLLDENGLSYILKRPLLSAYRRRRKLSEFETSEI